MTIEEKAKAHDKVSKEVKDFFEGRQKMYSDVEQTLKYLFPELTESEDEKIRKSLTILLQHFCKGYRVPGLDFPVSYKDMLAWLERQGEQETMEEKKPKKDTCIGCYYAINHECAIDIKGYCPREKHFDYENANIRQKDFASIDEYEGLTDFERTLADICIGWIGKEIGWKEYIKDNADVLFKIAIKKFNSVQDALFEQKPTDEEMKTILRTEYEKGRADTIAEMQKPAWSEEDEKMLKDTIRFCELCGNQVSANWLKSLKGRVQPKHEWSEEDENTIKVIIEDLEYAEKKGYVLKNNIFLKEIHWLKSLKPQGTWKPSDEQMKALHDLNLTGNISYAGQGQTLIELYNDLYTIWKEKEVFK